MLKGKITPRFLQWFESKVPMSTVLSLCIYSYIAKSHITLNIGVLPLMSLWSLWIEL